MKYYSLNKINSKKATYNVIFGERSNGKTYACLQQALENYFNNGSQFAYIMPPLFIIHILILLLHFLTVNCNDTFINNKYTESRT